MNSKKRMYLAYDQDYNKHQENWMNKTGQENSDNIRNGRRVRAKRLSRVLKTIMLLSFIALILYLGRGQVKGFVLQFFIKTIPVEYSVLEDERSTSFLMIRREKAITSPFKGRFEKKYHEGERVSNNAVVGYLVETTGTSLEKTERIPVRSPSAGVLSYYTDGYENLCNPEVWPELDLNKLVELKEGLVSSESGETKNNSNIDAGQRLFKIVDNLAPAYIFTDIELNDETLLQSGCSVNVKLDIGDNLKVEGIVKQIEHNNSNVRLLLEITASPSLREYRKVDGTIVVNNYEGVVLEQDILVDRDGKKGVYVLNKGLVEWQEIGIIGLVGNKAAIDGLRINDLIVATPGFVEEGQRLNIFND